MDHQRAQPYSGYYNHRQKRSNDKLAQVGPGTPCGEYLRRFWHPFMKTADLGDLPKLTGLLGEELVAFRDKSGRYGLVHKHCPHRHVSLEFGILTHEGIRCSYHGWEFDVNGTVTRAPAEENDASIRASVCLGAYPVIEFRGLLFAYLGPPEERPPFPLYDTFEIEDGEVLPYQVDIPCNWLQVAENSMDPMHVVFLHTRVNVVQFNERLGVLPIMDFRERPFGLFYTKSRRLNDDYVWISTNDLILPNFTQAGSVYNSTEGKEPKYFGRNSFSRWVVPIDDTHTTVLAFRHFNHRSEESRPELRTSEALEKIDIGELRDRPYEERQRNPGDYDVFIGQGAVTPHLSERLATSDRGVVLFRRRLEQEIDKLQQGQRPLQASSVFGNHPIPTYGSDTVLRLPFSNDGDVAARKSLLERVGNIYVLGDQYRGDKRYAFLEGELGKLNANP
jgi:phenylpropionate dioxygenase-like ring-hydroxylating dioxygenase large terminal subunit